MKRIIGLLYIILSLGGYAQPQWKFHLAFEDATGAKDTIWMIWDTNANGTLPTDVAMGEGQFPFNYNAFNVWVYNYDSDSTKTSALPFYGSFGVEIRAMNCQFPLSISWDSTLFHAPWLPEPVDYAYMGNGYFFGTNNCPLCQAFNMLIDNHVTISEPWVNSGNFFPLFGYIMRGSSVSVIENKFIKRSVSIYPNPASSTITVAAKEIKVCELINNTGAVVLSKEFYNDLNYTLSVGDISSGFYNLKITNNKNETYYEKVLINN